MAAEIEDTYAEGFRSIYAEVLITARDRKWLDIAVGASTGNASSSILCDCEAALDRYVGPGGDESYQTPDGRPGALVQFHIPRFRKDRVEALGRSLSDLSKCPHLCHRLLFFPGSRGRMGPIGPKTGLLWGPSPISRCPLRPQGVGGSHPWRRVYP